MSMFFSEFFVFFLASLLTLILTYFKVSTNTLQQIIAFLLAVLLIFSSRVVFSRSPKIQGLKAHYILLFLTASFVQLLVISTGGFYSPFLIVLHLYTLGSSFLLNSRSSLSFLVLSVALLVMNILLNSQMLALFQDDPGTVLLYFVSFVVVIPLAQFLMYTYHIKDTISKILKEYIQIGEKREESILQGLSEIVVVTDKNLTVISVNESAEKSLGVNAAGIIGKSLLAAVPLKDEAKNPIKAEALSADKVIADKTTRIIQGLLFQFKSDTQPRRVIVQARPITDSDGEVNQIVFIINDALISDSWQRHSDLEQSRAKFRSLAENLTKSLLGSKLNDKALWAELLVNIEEDLLTAQEIEDHLIKQIISFQDVAFMAKEIVSSKQQLASGLGIYLNFVLPKEEIAENALLSLAESDFPKEALPVSGFTIPTDKKWLEEVLKKAVDLFLLLASEKSGTKVQLAVIKQGDKAIIISLSCPYPPLDPRQQTELFTQYYGSLQTTTNLKLGSGLEGFIIKSVTSQLNIPLTVKVADSPPCLVLELSLAKVAPNTLDTTHEVVSQ